jgi:two-component system, OmpR family, phosphate regulon sensor histidine kinase PhoR
MKPSFARRLTASYLFVVAVTLVFTGAYLTRRLRQDFLKHLEESLAAQAALVGQTFRPDLSAAPGSAPLQYNIQALGQAIGCRITLIRPDGVVLADSERTPEEVAQMDNHLQRPEVQIALKADAGESMRTSATLQKQMLYVATPIRQSIGKTGPILGLLRLSLPTTEVDQRLALFRKDLFKAGGAALVVALLVALFSVHRIGQPLRELVASAHEIGEGRYSTTLSVRSADEFGRLARAFSEMANRIEEKVGELSRERTQLATILSALVESVVALDHLGRVLFLNPAAERLFGVRSADAKGRPFLEALRHSALNQVLVDALKRKEPVLTEITLHAPEERILSVQALPVNYGETETGVLAALHDITELRRLERMRQEFVANASHELKTPLTAIKGFVETLLEGAIDDPKHNREFLETIQEQSNRLMRLIEDLLDLSAIEAKRVEYRFEPTVVSDVIERIFKGLEPMAKAKKVRLINQLASDLPRVRADREKLGQILMNLIDNGIKFNKPDGTVRLSAQIKNGFLEVTVADTGMGIATEDLPRVFERFFRTDRSHSHDIAGTGLGLAIVKHLVENHQGKAAADSRLGEGSTFRFTLPLA